MSARLWEKVAHEIELSIKNRTFAPGDKLPTEAEFSRQFMVNRHTLRRALAHLQERGLIKSTQGRGSYVRRPAVRYTIGKRTRFTDVMRGLALESATKTRSIEVVPAVRQVADGLDIKIGDKVIMLQRIGYVGEEPISLATHYFSYARFPVFAQVYRQHRSVTQTLLHCGVLDFTRKRTVVQSRLPTPEECRVLNLPNHVPLILTRSWNVDPMGDPLEYGEGLFASDRVELDITPTEPIDNTPKH